MNQFLSTTALTTVFLSLASAALADSGTKVGVVGVAGATVTDTGEQGVRTLKAGDAIYLGDVVKTGAGSEVQLVFLDHSTLMLKPNSDITVDSFVYDPSTASGDMALKSAEGAFRFIGGALSKKKPVEIATPVGTIGIRGGIVDATVGTANHGGADAVFVYGEKLSFSNVNGLTQSTTTYGTGFNLPTPTSIPTVLAANIVAQHFDSFRAPISSGSTGGAERHDVEQKLNLGTETQAPKPSDGHTDSNVPQATTTTTTATAEQPGATASGPAGTESAPSTANTPLVAFAAPIAPPAPIIANKPPIDINAIRTTASTSQQDQAVHVAANDPVIAPPPPANGAPANGTLPPPPPPANTASTDPATTPPHNSLPPVIPTVAPTYVGQYQVLDKTTGNMLAASNLHGDNIDAAHIHYLVDDGSGRTFDVTTNSVHGGTEQEFSLAASTVIDGDTYDSVVYSSANGAMEYYFFNGPVDQIKVLTGKSIFQSNGLTDVVNMQNARNDSVTKSNLRGTGDITFYNFLPDLGSAQLGSSKPGFFHYNIPASMQSSLLGGYATPSAPMNDIGLGINWNTGKFLSANLMFDSMQGGKPFMRVAFGNVDNTGSADQQHFLSGTTVSFDGPNNGTGLAAQTNGNLVNGGSGTVAANKNIYGTAGNGIEGFALNYTNATAQGTVNGVAPATLAPFTTPQSVVAGSTVHGSAGTPFNGFAGGLIIDNAQGGGTSGVKAYGTQAYNEVNVTPSLANGTVSGDIQMTALSDSQTIRATFGNATDPTKSAYLSDGAWAAQQQSVEYNGSGFSSGANAKNGALVEGSHVSNVNAVPPCNCGYTSWGLWGGDAKDDATARIDAAPMVPVVMGKVTQNIASAGLTNTNAHYTGPAYANVYDGATYSNAVGTMDAHINLQSPTLTSLSVDFPAGRLPNGNRLNVSTISPVTIQPSGPAFYNSAPVNTQVQWNGTNLPGANAQMHGTLNGPVGQEIGGNFAVESPTVKAGGIYLGK